MYLLVAALARVNQVCIIFIFFIYFIVSRSGHLSLTTPLQNKIVLKGHSTVLAHQVQFTHHSRQLYNVFFGSGGSLNPDDVIRVNST